MDRLDLTYIIRMDEWHKLLGVYLGGRGLGHPLIFVVVVTCFLLAYVMISCTINYLRL